MYITSEHKEILQKHLVTIRRILQLRAKDLGGYLGLTRQAINNFEIGKHSIRDAFFISIIVCLRYEYENKKEVLTAYDRKYVEDILSDCTKNIPYL